MQKQNLRVAVLGLLLLVVSGELAYGATYYVRRDGNNANTGSANTAAGAWLSIDFAADRVAAGDTVRVQAGTYPEVLTPVVSGTAGAPITFVADGAATFCGINARDTDYLRYVGFTIDTGASGCTKASRAVWISGTTLGWELWNNTIRNATVAGIASSSFADRAHNWVVIGNVLTGFGCCSGVAVAIRGNHNVFAYNTISNSDPDDFIIDGTYSYWLNNYVVKTVTNNGHGDVFQSGASSLGLAYNTFEGNFFVGEGDVSDEHGALLQSQSTSSCSSGTCAAMTENLFRRNVWHNLSGSHLSADSSDAGFITNTREVNDTVVETMRMNPTAGYSAVLRAGNTGYFFNNLNYKAWGANVIRNAQVFVADTGASVLASGFNLAYTPDITLSYMLPWTSQVSPLINVDPRFVDAANDNFTLQAGSAARGSAGALTRTNGAGTGTTFNVVAGGGGFFRGPNTNVTQYGGNLTTGDVITVGIATRTVVRVAGDAITVSAPLSWAHGEPVYLGASATPEIGAYPYQAGGFQLTASYAVAGGIATVTPSNAGIVRFVVCYQDGVPTTVDNAGPFTCPAGSGTLEARVYPLYASKTTSVRATSGLAPPRPTAPTNLRIVP